MKVFTSLKSFIEKCKRVWMVLKKPSKDELVKVAQISALGILVVGFLGFIISIIIGFFN
ncbi:protein translocase SEC61 complex subunit gamma [Candidatus Pacearchaeota archaeon]|jgi:protein transport protein SEC61 subunit gamma-like protein|nr:protein translocase SEC61 complex subunit gamma [Candidatus Pacearchaeota archaeon]